ncbi:MAG: BlaI/MecI/CopY family transcriptional regulator [Clostridiales bacterium]|nr:BlaI/MecI/CopY family transcriptional regulator [Clostridiales bacterium]MBQ5966177.1 BlaI/MecI/CopY family transcriptional regulator [Clostridiales bacterium]
MKKLPDAEFEIMKAIWHIEQPVTSPALTVVLSRDLPDRDWKQQTVMTMLGRLEKKGFLRSEKNGKERGYYAVVSESQYMNIEAESLKSRFGANKMSGFVKALYSDGEISDEDINDLKNWLNDM